MQVQQVFDTSEVEACADFDMLVVALDNYIPRPFEPMPRLF